VKYLYKKIVDYLSVYVRPDDSLVEVDACEALDGLSANSFHENLLIGDSEEVADRLPPTIEISQLKERRPDYVLINGAVHYWRDIQERLRLLHSCSHRDQRLIITYYSSLWNPIIRIANVLGFRRKSPEVNWISPGDLKGLSALAGFEQIRDDPRILLPFYIPLISHFLNRYIAPMPILRHLCLLRIAVFRPKLERWAKSPSVSIVVPARNEAGNIEAAFQRIPKMGPEDELIFVEGNSTDSTWTTILAMEAKYRSQWGGRIKVAQQEGIGKGDAVRKGFGLAEKDILMILDADLTVPPEDLPKFYRAIVEDHGEYINGSRLVYPMEKEAMRFLNLLGNKFFAAAFSFVLSATYKDTLCGTKVLSRRHYEKLAGYRGYFGEFDPFGDFDLIFGASRMNLKTVEVPIRYRDRHYGETNISRWKHGVLLLRMLVFAARKILFI